MNLFYIRFMVYDMIPAKLVESKYFPEFLKVPKSKIQPTIKSNIRDDKNTFDELSYYFICKAYFVAL